MTPETAQWLAMAILAAIAAAVVTRPWWGGTAGVLARRAANVAAYRSRIAELAEERAAGLLGEPEAQALDEELGARLLADADETAPRAPASPPPGGSRRAVPIVLTVAALLAFAAVWYGLGGSWRAQREIAQAAEPAPRPAVTPEIAAMIEQLAQRLRTQPDDPEGWAMLGRSYFAMQRYAEAAQAYGEANQRIEGRGGSANADWLVGQGEAIAFADGREIPPASAALFERALTLAPADGKTLWYGGLSAAQNGRLSEARARWTALLKSADLPEPMRAAVTERLRALDAPPTADAAAEPPAASPVHLDVRVTLGAALAGKVPAGATLFVFAKAAEGPPMPLAVQRLPLARLPLQLALDDSMAMAPQLKLSQFDRYVLTARLSASGDAQPRSGDLQGSVTVDRADAGRPVELTIDRVLP